MGLATQDLGGFRVRVWSQGQGRPLLYLHGFEQHPGGAGFLVRLAERHRVFAPEQPGYGESTGFEGIDSLVDLVLFYRGLIDSWGLDGPVDVVGHCWGGMVAAELAAICPQVVRRLVLVDSYGLWLDEYPMVDPFNLSDAKLAAAKWHDPAGAPVPEPSILDLVEHDRGEAIIFRAQNLGTATKFLWPIPDRGLGKRLPLIQAPTLVIHGDSDGLVPVAVAEEFARLIPDARLVRVEAAGHLPMLEQADVFVDAVEKFVAG